MRVAIVAIIMTVAVIFFALKGMKTIPSAGEAKSKADSIQSRASVAVEQAPEPPKEDLSYDRNGYTKRLERALLSNGVSADIWVEKDTELVIWMPLSKAKVYQMALDGKILQNAYDRKFKTVNFWDRIGGGHWYFDMATGIPKCDRVKRICF